MDEEKYNQLYDLVKFIANDVPKFSQEKIVLQNVEYRKRAQKLLTKIQYSDSSAVERSLDKRLATGSNPVPSTKLFEVWCEGYQCTGQSAPAQYLGEVIASSFKEACDVLLKDDYLYDKDRLTLWSCRLFDNEKDARRSFG